MKRSLILFLFASCFLSACSPKNDKKPLEYKAEVFNGKWMTGEYVPAFSRFFLAGQYGSIVSSGDGFHWQNSQTPSLETLRDIATDSAQKIMLASGEGGTILRSVDKGLSWQTVRLNLPESVDFSNTRLNTLVFVEKHKIWLAAGTQNAILRSQDEGQSWDLVSYNTGQDQLEIIQLFVEKQTGDAMFAGQFGTTGRSTDGGVNWQISKHDMQHSGNYIPHVVGFHQFENIFIAAADLGRLLISRDAGASWELMQLATGGYFTGSAYDPQHKVIALTTQMGEVAITKDEGATWKMVSFEVNNWPSDDIPFLTNIIYDEVSQSFVLLGNSGVVARSVDGGQTWFADIFKPLFNMSVTSVLHDPKNNVFVAAGLGGAIASSNTLGPADLPLENWKLVRPGIDQYMREVINLPDSNTFIAVGQLGGIWRSDDDGVNWQVVDVAYPFPNQPPHLRAIVRDPENGAILSAGPVGSIMRSSDEGLTWTSVFQGKVHLGEAFTQIMHDKKRNAYLAVEVLYRSVYQSVDAGLSWEKIATIESDERNLWHGAVSDKLDLIMVVGQKGGVAISRDGGKQWSMAESNIYNDLFGAYADDKDALLLAVGENGMVLRSENGTDWQTATSNTASTLRRVFKDPKSKALIAFGQEGTIIRSTDKGQNWTKIQTPISSGELRHALLETETNNLLVVGRDGVVLRSSDGGLSWQRLPTHTTQHFRSAATNPKTGTIIVVGDGLVRMEKTN